MQPTVYGWPGEGAINYACEQLAGLTREQAAASIPRLLKELPDDKRVKRCDYCGYPWRDDSLRNTRRTCSEECKTGIKSLQRRQQRADKALLADKTKKRTKREQNYIWWLEYPFWLSEYEMLKQSWKFEIPTDREKLEYISGNQRVLGLGNRKRGAGKEHQEVDEEDRF